MKAVICSEWGPYERLQVADIEPPVAGVGEVVIDVRAIGLNFFDTLIVQKKYQYQPQLPFSPGGEVAGIVSAVGAGVSGFDTGDVVMAYVGYNGAREKVAVAAEKVVPVGGDISLETAAGLSVTYGTTLHGLRDRAGLKAGETLAVLGASGGVGQAAVEIGKAMGARVIACASSDDKLAFCEKLGADELLNYGEKDLKTELKRLTGGKGADVVYDPVGGKLTEAAVRATGWGGRFLVIGFASGTIAKIPLNLVLLKGCSLVGVFWGDHVEREPEKHRTNMAILLNWCRDGKIKPHIHQSMPLDQAVAALGLIHRREVKGKVILTV